MTVTIKDIAEAAGVSFSTVSKALRNSPVVQEKTKRRILEVADRMGYSPNLAARKLVSKRSGSFGVIWPSVERATPSILITQVGERLERMGYNMLLSINRAEAAIELFKRHQVDAILAFYDREQGRLNRQRPDGSVPILYYGKAGSAPYPTVDTKRGRAITLAVEHLAGLGHRRIAYIGDLPYPDPLQQEKIEAYRAGMQTVGGEARIIPVESLEPYDGYLAAKQLFQSGDLPTALISGSFDLSRGMLRAADEFGVRIPADLSLVGYDQIPQRDLFDLPLTTVGVEIEGIADRLAASLCELAAGRPHPDRIYLEPVIIERASTAPPRLA